MSDKRTHIITTLKETNGAGQDRRLYSYTRIAEDRTEVCVELSLTTRFPVKQFADAEALYELLGKYKFSIQSLVQDLAKKEGTDAKA